VCRHSPEVSYDLCKSMIYIVVVDEKILWLDISCSNQYEQLGKGGCESPHTLEGGLGHNRPHKMPAKFSTLASQQNLTSDLTSLLLLSIRSK
jgi:hypothetical protein